MSEPIRSTRHRGEAILTRAFVPDEDEDQVLVADIHHLDILAWLGDRTEPIHSRLDVDVEDPAGDGSESAIMFDTLRPWGVDSTGYNFEHWMSWGDMGFAPRTGMVRIEFTLHRYGAIAKPIVFVHEATLQETRSIGQIAIVAHPAP